MQPNGKSLQSVDLQLRFSFCKILLIRRLSCYLKGSTGYRIECFGDNTASCQNFVPSTCEAGGKHTQVLRGDSIFDRGAVEKKTVLENLDLILLSMDETVDGGCDAATN